MKLGGFWSPVGELGFGAFGNWLRAKLALNADALSFHRISFPVWFHLSFTFDCPFACEVAVVHLIGGLRFRHYIGKNGANEADHHLDSSLPFASEHELGHGVRG